MTSTISGDCAIYTRNGFLSNNCYDSGTGYLVDKCPFSDTYFTYYNANSDIDYVSQLYAKNAVTKRCPNDSRLYQACITVNRQDPIVMEISSDNVFSHCGMFTVESMDPEGFLYEYKHSNLDFKTTSDSTKCNGYCEMVACNDEAFCNGFQYGLFCESSIFDRKFTIHVMPQGICDGKPACQRGEDELGCQTAEDFFNESENDFSIILNFESTKRKRQCFSKRVNYGIDNEFFHMPQLNNFTRCSALIQSEDRIKSMTNKEGENELLKTSSSFPNQILRIPFAPYCKFYIDQTNCSDPQRGVLSCLIDGYPSTVSKFAICVQAPGLCDDGLDNLCVRTSGSCNVHKHQLCNGEPDCADKTDETTRICAVTVSACYRRYRHETELPIPMAWLEDGFSDCSNGDDEKRIWPKCGSGEFSRNVLENSECEDVLICSYGS